MRTNNILKIFVIFIVVAFVVSGFMFNENKVLSSTLSGTYNEYERNFSVNDFNSINIKYTSLDCEFITEERSDVRVVYKGYGNFSSSIFANTLNIEETFRWANFYKDSTLTIYAPSNFDKNFKLRCTSGSFKANNVTSKQAELRVISGKVSIDNFAVDDLYIRMTSGSIESTKTSIKNGSFNVTSGRMFIEVINKFESINAFAVAGRLSFILDKDIKPSVSFNAIAGNIKSEFSTNNDNDESTMELKVVSGNISIRKSK